MKSVCYSLFCINVLDITFWVACSPYIHWLEIVFLYLSSTQCLWTAHTSISTLFLFILSAFWWRMWRFWYKFCSVESLYLNLLFSFLGNFMKTHLLRSSCISLLLYTSFINWVTLSIPKLSDVVRSSLLILSGPVALFLYSSQPLLFLFQVLVS